MRINLDLKYVISITAILVSVMGLTLFVISKKHEALVIEQTRIQAKALFQQVVITRRWIADHGGVFVEKLPWVEVNPYLKNPLITDSSGKSYVKENPAMVTKQLSTYAQKDKLYSFHITSLKLMNPENAPDAFEKKALLEFEERHNIESSKIEETGGARYFRYIAPLYVEEACLECHFKQGYKIGDIRGAISITVPMDYAYSVIASDRKYMLSGGAVMVSVMIGGLFLLTRRLVTNPIQQIRSSISDFSRDARSDIPVLETHDEIEDLSRSFSEMARSINGYHSCLQDRILAATDELREKNEALLRLNRNKSEFVAKISHELRTPLTSIKGAMDYLSVKIPAMGSKEKCEGDIIDFLDVIKNNADRLIRLVNNVLDYERIELGEFGMNFWNINLRDTFEEVVSGFRSEALEKDVAIDLLAQDVFVNADEDRIKQVMINLISNAFNFSPRSSRITVKLEENDAWVLATVTDKGSGIPENEKSMVFREFYSKGVKGGTGLGLAICKSIIEAHDGTIGLQSTVGKGSSFYFKIPRERSQPDGHDTTDTCN